MIVETGTKREITLADWNRQLARVEKRLAKSKECYSRFNDEDSKQWIVEDQAAVDAVKKDMQEVIAYMDLHNIK